VRQQWCWSQHGAGGSLWNTLRACVLNSSFQMQRSTCQQLQHCHTPTPSSQMQNPHLQQPSSAATQLASQSGRDCCGRGTCIQHTDGSRNRTESGSKVDQRCGVKADEGSRSWRLCDEEEEEAEEEVESSRFIIPRVVCVCVRPVRASVMMTHDTYHHSWTSRALALHAACPPPPTARGVECEDLNAAAATQ